MKKSVGWLGSGIGASGNTHGRFMECHILGRDSWLLKSCSIIVFLHAGNGIYFYFALFISIF